METHSRTRSTQDDAVISLKAFGAMHREEAHIQVGIRRAKRGKILRLDDFRTVQADIQSTVYGLRRSTLLKTGATCACAPRRQVKGFC